MKTYLGNAFIGFALGVAVSIGSMIVWQRFQPPAVEGKVAPAIANLPTETIPIKSVKVYVPAAKKKLDLPKDVQADPTAHVTAATTVTCDDRDKTVTSVLNDDGRTTMFVKSNPLPWFQREKTTQFSLDYGQKQATTGFIYRLGARADLLQIKSLHAGINGSLDSNGAWFYGVGVRFTIR